MRVAASIAVGLLVAVGLYLVLREDGDAARSIDDEEAAPHAEDAPTLLAAGTAAKPEPKPASGEDPVPADEPEDAPAHHVEGVVEGLSAAHLAATDVRVHLLGSYDWVNSSQKPAVAAPRPDGRFRIDIGALRGRVPTADRIQVSVDHPEHVVVRVKLDLAPVASGVTRLADPIRLQRAFRIAALVVDADGEPVEDAAVVLLPMEGDQPVEGENAEVVVFEDGETDDEGRITLRAPVAGPALLAAHRAGHLPAWERLAISEDDLTPHALRLGRACSLSGTVTLNGAPLKAADMEAGSTAKGTWLNLGRFNGRWHDGRLAPSDMRGKSDADGRFEIRGLAPGPYAVKVSNPEGYRLWRTVSNDARVDVEAPATGVRVELAVAVVEVRVVSGGEPLQGARVMMGQEKKGSSGTSTGRSGVLTHLLTPGEKFQFEVKHDRHAEEKAFEVGPLEVGQVVERTVDLGPPRAEGTLVVVLRDEADRPVTKAGFRLAEDYQGQMSSFDDGIGERESEAGAFRLEGLKAGKTTLVVTPGRGTNEYRGRYLLIAKPVTVQADRETRVELTARRGARVFLTVRDESGNPLESSAKLRDGRGEDADVMYYWSDETSATMSSGGPGPKRTTIVPPLEPGAYEIECSATGYITKKVPFVVEADTEKELVVELRKE